MSRGPSAAGGWRVAGGSEDNATHRQPFEHRPDAPTRQEAERNAPTRWEGARDGDNHMRRHRSRRAQGKRG